MADENFFSRAVKAVEGLMYKFERGGDMPAPPDKLLELEPVSPPATPAAPRVGKSKDGETIGI